MSKQKVFFFSAPGEGSDYISNPIELLQMAVNYVTLYGEGCLNDFETPSVVRQCWAGSLKLICPGPDRKGGWQTDGALKVKGKR